MINRDREIAATAELEPPCHFLFDLKRTLHPIGLSLVNDRQVDSPGKIPLDAINVRPIREGEVILVRHDNLAKDNPWPVRFIHSHKGSVEPSLQGFETVSTIEKPLGLIEGLLWKRKHPLPLGHRLPRRSFSPPWLEY